MNFQQQKPKRRKIWLWVLLAVLALLIAAAVIKSKNKPKGTEVYTEKVTRRDLKETVSASGKIFPEKEIKISSDVSGEVVELYVKEGDSVKLGQILARVNPDVYQSAIERGAAGVNAAKAQSGVSSGNINSAKYSRDQIRAQRDNASKIYQRNKELYKEGVISQLELESSETNLKNLESSLQSAENAILSATKSAESAGYQVKDAEAVLREQRTNLGRTVIKAPANGIISKLNIEKGERVVGTMQMSGTELMRIADFGAMEVQIEVSENDIIRVSTGQETEIEVDAYQNRRFKGTVTEVANSASTSALSAAGGLNTDQVTKFLVKVRIAKDSYKDLLSQGKSAPFKPGMSATVEIKTNEVKSVLSIPIQAVIAYDTKAKDKKDQKESKENEQNKLEEKEVSLHSSQFKEAVFKLSADSCSRIDVVTGIQDESYIEIKSGLAEDEEIIIGPYSAIAKKLKSGDKVHKKKEEDEKK